MKTIDPSKIKLSAKAQKELDELREKFHKEVCAKCPFYKECRSDDFNCRIKLR